MHGINTLVALNEAAAASQEKAAWPAPVAAENIGAGSGNAPQVDREPLPDAPAISRVEQ